MPRKITPATSLEHLRKEAKRWLKELRADNPDARVRFERAYPTAPVNPVLRDVQHALAHAYGHESWIALTQAVETLSAESAASTWRTRTAEEYERLANDLVLAYDSHDQAALQRLNEHYHRSFTFDDLWAEIWRRVYAFRQRSFKVPKNYLQFTEAQTLIAQDAGFGSWTALTRADTAHRSASSTPRQSARPGTGGRSGSQREPRGSHDFTSEALVHRTKRPLLVPRKGHILRWRRFPEHCRTPPGNPPRPRANSPHQSLFQ